MSSANGFKLKEGGLILKRCTQRQHHNAGRADVDTFAIVCSNLLRFFEGPASSYISYYIIALKELNLRPDHNFDLFITQRQQDKLEKFSF